MADWFFGFRQVFPKPSGKWVAQGPYGSPDEAKAARDTAKAWDAEVSVAFLAGSLEEAQESCDAGKFF